MRDILERLAHSSQNESSHELQCRCFDAAEEISRLRKELERIYTAPVASMDTRDALGICAPTEDAFPALYALQGKRVRLVLDENPNDVIQGLEDSTMIKHDKCKNAAYCEWIEQEGGVWETDCGNLFELNAGTPLENNMKFCQYCGKRLTQTANVEEV